MTNLAITNLAPTAEATYAELWISFTAMLKCYIAAHGLHRKTAATLEVSAQCLVLRCENHWLEITHHGNRGTCKREDGGTVCFDLQLDGRVSMNEVSEEMDAVAEKLAREITR